MIAVREGIYTGGLSPRVRGNPDKDATIRG